MSSRKQLTGNEKESQSKLIEEHTIKKETNYKPSKMLKGEEKLQDEILDLTGTFGRP